ncbi:hypothetical protein [Streptomyces sp. DH12]|uniref:hypothetical protein n=1 Tax=Streptomyces sp. DH12 TaxID=2857010 RepID=UPI001E3F7DDC|nr:hypothetical protein [Streptomyces sp. DH12]
MPLDTSFQITSDELNEIYARLQPYFPKYLTKIEPHTYGIRFEFQPFTGREEEPIKPLVRDDPKLSYVAESDNQTEYLIREKAHVILSNLYYQAREKWGHAAYVADLKDVVRDTPDRWKTYQHELKALGTAYDYLRTPDAAREWPAAVSRLIDAQDRTRAAARAFDQRAREIAQVRETHLGAELTLTEALAAAGYPDSRDWDIADARDYGQHYYSDWDSHPLEETTRRLIEQQDNHVAKVGRLSGASSGS